MTAEMLTTWLAAFASTIIIETPIVALFAKDFMPVRRSLGMSLILQMTTHPLLWLTFFDLMDAVGSYTTALIIAETLVFVVESSLLAWMWGGRWRWAFLTAFTANVASTAVGLLR